MASAPEDREAVKLHAPSAVRNRDPLLAVLRRVLPASGVVLEVASGTGQHAAWFAAHLPGLGWQPTDPDPARRASIAAWADEAGAPDLRPPLDLDVLRDPWPVPRADAVVCVNLIHIAPWRCAEALFRGAARLLPPGGPLVLYGPYRVAGAHTADSNAAFDASLRGQDPDWGVRDLEAVVTAAARAGLDWSETVPMPANNLTVVFRRAGVEDARGGR